MIEKVGFSIDCEWLCNFIRDKVYYEGSTWSDGIKMLIKSFGIDSDTADDILRGKKVIRGINSGTLEDDNKYQEYLDYQKKLDEKRIKHDILVDMTINPLNYVDPFATKYSFWGFEKEWGMKKSHDIHMVTREDVIQYFEYHTDMFSGHVNDLSNTFLRGGCYGLELPDYLYNNRIINGPVGSRFEFYDSLYVFFEKLLTEETWLSDEDKREIRMRQESHRAWRRAQYYKSDEYIDKRIEEITARQTENKKQVLDFLDGSEYSDCITYIPTDKMSAYGIITPDGDFYACDYGTHKFAAFMIAKQKNLLENPDLTYAMSEDLHEAKSKLYDLGYTFVNTIGHAGCMNKWNMDFDSMPQKAIDKCFDWQLWDREEND